MCASFSSWFLFANHLSSRFSSIYLMIKSINQSTYDVPSLSKYNKSLSLCSWKRPWAIWGDPVIWLATQTGKMGPSYSDGIARLDLAQEKDCVERTYQVRDFFLQCRQWSRKKAKKKIKHFKTLMVSRPCYKYSSISFPALETNKSKSFLILIILKFFAV